MSNTLKVLDCTLRDGGQGLESLDSLGINTSFFSEEEKKIIIDLLGQSGIDIIEIGCMSGLDDNKEKYAIYKDIESLSCYLPKNRNKKALYTGLYIGPDTPMQNIPDYSEELVEGIRVILRYSQLQQSIDYCRALARKGYKVFIQPMLTMRYTDEELDRLVYAANEMGAYALYYVDSFGYMKESDVERFYKFYADKLDPHIQIGFHAHNNMENAFINAKFFVEELKDRNKIVDACAIGMGQGAGNLQTELLVAYLNNNCNTNYDLNCVLEVCDIIDRFRAHDMETWGYSPVRFIPALYGVAYKYAMDMRLNHNMSLVDINKALSHVPEELKHRYTPENLKRIIGI